MKKSDVLVGGIVYAFYMFFSCLVIMCAEILIIKVVNLFVVTEYFAMTVIRAVTYVIGVNAVLGIIAYKEGYRAARYPIAETALSGILATVIHLIFCMLFSFQAFCAGGVRFIAVLLRFGDELVVNTQMDTLGILDFLPVFAINSLVYIIVMILCGKLGENKRLIDRDETTDGVSTYTTK